MFIGEYTHTLDPKNRLSMPSRFRRELGKAVVVTRGLDHCLFVYPQKEWTKEAAQHAAHASGSAAGRGLARLFLAGAMEVDIDSAGRVLIPDHLRQYAGLSAKVVVAGVAGRVEIWDEEAWRTYTQSIERDADRLAESVNEN